MLTELEAARYKQCDKRTIRSAIERGDLVLYRGKLRQGDLDAWAPKARRPRQGAATAQPAEAAGTDEPNEVLTPQQRLKVIELERAEQAWARDRGLLLEREDVTRLLADFGHRIRSAIQSLPRKLQGELVRKLRCKDCGGPIDGKAIAIAAERHVDDLLREVANEPM